MPINLKRAYDEPEKGDGYRVLVDRLWPRGVSKGEIQIDAWLKEIAPSVQLRRAFHDDEITWGEFRKAYLSELTSHREKLRSLAERAENEPVTLLFGAKDTEHNNAVVLKQYLSMLDTG